ncbi:hypothetical protein [Bradyrhizobium sp. OK095]|uniref:hypothetical protein n=1 Tax=Bradyrhizobium sp. OK095 TaxID=1882760 RepID=UPI0008C7952D|nr:hypothetical protein [Bradyrhizobium sp. OK095]SEO17722.1 hypothetical protein SAMN05443254_12013 [Bradyrhizobium sp. OK095]
MTNRFSNMTKADLVEAIQVADRLIISTQKYSEDLRVGRAVTTDRLSVEKLLESNAKMIEAKLAEIKEMNDELGRRP